MEDAEADEGFRKEEPGNQGQSHSQPQADRPPLPITPGETAGCSGNEDEKPGEKDNQPLHQRGGKDGDGNTPENHQIVKGVIDHHQNDGKAPGLVNKMHPARHLPLRWNLSFIWKIV